MDKIPRAFTLNLLSQVENLIDDNNLIEQFFAKLSDSLSAVHSQSQHLTNETLHISRSDDWFLKTYIGKLNVHDLSALEVV